MADVGCFAQEAGYFRRKNGTCGVQKGGASIHGYWTTISLPVGVFGQHDRAAWAKRSSEGRDYLSVKLDDPSFNAPIFANLFEDEGGEGHTLIWSRARKTNGE